MPLRSFKDRDRVRLAGFRAINGGKPALPSAGQIQALNSNVKFKR